MTIAISQSPAVSIEPIQNEELKLVAAVPLVEENSVPAELATESLAPDVLAAQLIVSESTPETKTPVLTALESTLIEIPQSNLEAVTSTTPDAEIDAITLAELSQQSESLSPTNTDNDSELKLESDDADQVEVKSVVIGERFGDVVKILDTLIVSTSQLMVQQSPIDTQHGYVYTANIEPGLDGDVDGTNLHTVVRQGLQNADGSWRWAEALIENRTVHNQWHTAPSVVADKDGFIHVAYNMHNNPWQYKRSDLAHDLTEFSFLGQSITQAEIDLSKYQNQTHYPTLGYAEIPGNQITYPAFYKSPNRDIYVTYRFAAKPNRSFAERTMSGGVAAYDTQMKNWRAIGAQVQVEEGGDYLLNSEATNLPVSIASDTGWTVYHPRLMFGPSGDLHMNWFFRQGIAGAELSRPCYAKSQDNYVFLDAHEALLTLPLTASDCGNVGFPDTQSFYSVGNSTMDSNGNPHMVLSPIDSARKIVSFDTGSEQWVAEESPNGATEIFFDTDDNLWAIASGIRIMVRLNGSDEWNTIYTDSTSNACFPKVSVNESGDVAFIHTHACDQKSVTIYGVRLR